MKILTGRVVAGKIEVPNGAVEEGSTVTVLVPDAEDSFELSAEEVRELHSSLD